MKSRRHLKTNLAYLLLLESTHWFLLVVLSKKIHGVDRLWQFQNSIKQLSPFKLQIYGSFIHFCISFEHFLGGAFGDLNQNIYFCEIIFSLHRSCCFCVRVPMLQYHRMIIFPKYYQLCIQFETLNHCHHIILDEWHL